MVLGRPLLQYRGKLMPIVPANPMFDIRREGRQPLVIFSDGERTMGLAVEAIVDILDETVEIEFSNDEPGVLGSAVLAGRATEMVDLAYYLPQAYPDWLTRRRGAKPKTARNVLLLESSDFIREMLAPVVKAAGFNPVACANAAEAKAALASGRAFAAAVVDIEGAQSGGFEALEAIREGDHGDALLIGLASIPHPDLLQRAHAAGLHDVIAKFDRQALIGALGGHDNQLREAA